MRAIVIGATGLTGGLLLNQLLQDDAFTHIKLVLRRPVERLRPKLEQVLINFEDETAFKNAISHADVLFCCIGTTQKKVKGDRAAYRKVDFDIPVRAARFCVEHNIQKYIMVSAVSANADSRNFYLQLKGEAEEAILSMRIDSIHIMRPSILLGSRHESRLGEAIAKGLMQFISFFLFGNMAKYKVIRAADVAAAMRAAAKNPSKEKLIYNYREIMRIVPR